MTAKTENTARKPEPAKRPANAGLVAKYGAIGNAAIRAALQFRKPAKPATAK